MRFLKGFSLLLAPPARKSDAEGARGEPGQGVKMVFGTVGGKLMSLKWHKRFPKGSRSVKASQNGGPGPPKLTQSYPNGVPGLPNLIEI